MNVKQARFDRSILRLLGIRGACALVALGLLGVHSAEGRPRVAVPPGQGAAVQGIVQSDGYLPCEQRRPVPPD